MAETSGKNELRVFQCRQIESNVENYIYYRDRLLFYQNECVTIRLSDWCWFLRTLGSCESLAHPARVMLHVGLNSNLFNFKCKN